MRSISAVIVPIGALTLATAVAASQPAMAGPACDELDLRSPCIRSNDLRANITLGGSTGDARLQLKDDAGAQGVQLRATTGNVINRFSNEEEESNGLVKAWAQIEADGTIVACWRCNTDPAETRRFANGSYEVDFTPLATDITGRPRSATIDDLFDGEAEPGSITLADREAGDLSSVFVGTHDASGAFSDRPFVLIIY
jgi:hypothetical protein